MIRAVIYFLGPRTAWSKKIDESEIIASKLVRARFAARWWAVATIAPLDRSRCGWALVDECGEMLEHCQPLELPA